MLNLTLLHRLEKDIHDSATDISYKHGLCITTKLSFLTIQHIILYKSHHQLNLQSRMRYYAHSVASMINGPKKLCYDLFQTYYAQQKILDRWFLCSLLA